MSEPEVKVILDSISPKGDRITTFELKYWRPLLPEMNTHRVFSRNAASSRARGFEKNLQQVITSPWFPEHWNAEQPGMQGGEEFPDDVKAFLNEEVSLLAKEVAIKLQHMNLITKMLTGKEIHKQYLNRYLEPFMPVTQLVTATDWDNFLNLRLSAEAQPEMRDVAERIKFLLDTHRPAKRVAHYPYITEEEYFSMNLDHIFMVSVARCARVAYRSSSEKTYNIQKDIDLYNRLLENKHMSPFEHVAYPHEGRHANFNGWESLRETINL